MHCYTAGLGSSPFARRYWGNRCYFLFLQVLRCFSSLRSPPENLRMRGSLPPGCPIRTSAGLCAFAARRSFSQLVTSFFASESPGIPHAPLVVPLFLHRTELSSIMLFAIDLLDCETSVVFLLLSLAIDSLELIHDCQSASSMSLSFFLSGEPRGGQAP